MDVCQYLSSHILKLLTNTKQIPGFAYMTINNLQPFVMKIIASKVHTAISAVNANHCPALLLSLIDKLY